MEDERNFYSWEDTCKVCYPADWDVGEGYLFQENLKRMVEKYSPKDDRRYNIDDVM